MFSCLLSVQPLLLSQATAQESATPEASGRTEVVDTREGQDGVASTTVIDRGQMEDAASDLPEVLDRQPGVVVSRTGGLGSFASVSIRGSTPEQVLLMLNDVPLVSSEGNPFDLSMLPLGLLGRIVVTRGSVPAAFGVSAIGGVVQAKTRTIQAPTIEVEGSAGSFKTRGARVVGGYGDMAGEFSVIAAASYLGSEGDFPYLNDGGTRFDDSDDAVVGRDNNHFDRLTGLISIEVKPSSSLRLTFTELLTWRHKGLPWVGLYQTEQTQSESMQNILGASVQLDLPGAKGRRLTLAPWLSVSQTTIEDPLGEFAGRLGTTEDHSLLHGYRLSLCYPVDIVDAPGLRLSPLGTAVYRHESFIGRDILTSGTERSVHTRHRVAAIGQLTLSYTPVGLAFILSGRYEGAVDHSNAEGTQGTHIGSFRAGLAYRPLDPLLLRVNVARGTRFPTLFERFGDSAYVLGRASLLPERGTTLDLGLRVDWPELRAGEYFYAELLGFASWVEDLIHYAQNSQGIARPDNTEAARSAGVELALSGDVWRHLRLHGHLTWMHTENRGTIVARRGKSLPFRPTLRVFLRVEAYGDIGQGQQLGATLDATYASGHALDHSNLVTVDERLILGAGAWFEALESQLRVALNVRNLTDAHLVDFSGYPMPGLTAMVSVTGRPALD